MVKCPKCGKELTFESRTVFYHRSDGSIFERLETTFGCFGEDGCGWFDDD